MAKRTRKPAPKPVVKNGVGFSATGKMTGVAKPALARHRGASAQRHPSSGVVGLPPGLISPFAGATAPAGYLLCDGTSLAAATYPALFAVIGYTYGGSGANFTLPDLRSRFPIGVGTGTGLTARTLGGAVGAEKTALVATDVPAHGHGNTFATSPETTDHTHGVGTLVTGNQSANHTHTGSVSANNTYVSANGSATTVTTTGGATRINTLTYTTPTGSFTTNGVSVNHNHAITGSTGSRSASHTHAITGGVSNSAASTTSPAVIPPALGLNYIIKT